MKLDHRIVEGMAALADLRNLAEACGRDPKAAEREAMQLARSSSMTPAQAINVVRERMAKAVLR